MKTDELLKMQALKFKNEVMERNQILKMMKACRPGCVKPTMRQVKFGTSAE